MTKLICVNCQCEFKPLINGVDVVEMAQFGPYKLWSADLVQCPGCGAKVITGFSRTFVEHWQPGFNQYFDRAKQRGSLYFDYEKPQLTP